MTRVIGSSGMPSTGICNVDTIHNSEVGAYLIAVGTVQRRYDTSFNQAVTHHSDLLELLMKEGIDELRAACLIKCMNSNFFECLNRSISQE